MADQKESLGMEEYYEGIAEYITKCDTPTTITIEGEWGVGKTYALKKIRDFLTLKNNASISAENRTVNPEIFPNPSSKSSFLTKLLVCLDYILETLIIGILQDHKKLSNSLESILNKCQDTFGFSSLQDQTSLYKYNFIWFDTWKYDTLGIEDNLSLALLTHLNSKLDTLSPKEEKRKEKEKKNKALSTLSKRILNSIGNVNDVAGLISEASSSFDDFANLLDIQLVTERISDLQKEIKDKISTYIPKDGCLIIFVDDLDRLDPVRAVELLAGIHNLMHFEKCIFILAIETSIITEGIKIKYNYSNSGEDTEKCTIFLDKLIQVPFQLPTHKYIYDNFIETHLNKTYTDNKYSLPIDKVTLEKYIKVTKYFPNYNPRSITRIFNLFNLNIMIYQKVLQTKASPNNNPTFNLKDNLINLFILVTLEQQDPREYNTLTNMADKSEFTPAKVPNLYNLLESLYENKNSESELEKAKDVLIKLVELKQSSLKFDEKTLSVINSIKQYNPSLHLTNINNKQYIFTDKSNNTKLKFHLANKDIHLNVYTNTEEDTITNKLKGHGIHYANGKTPFPYVNITLPKENSTKNKDEWKTILEFLLSEGIHTNCKEGD